MKIENPKLRSLFATAGPCEYCGKLCNVRAGHHCWSQTPALDIRINLFFVGAPSELHCKCHALIHAGKINRAHVLRLVARRESTRPELIEEVIFWMRRHVKPTRFQLERAMNELSDLARGLAIRELSEAGLLEPLETATSVAM